MSEIWSSVSSTGAEDREHDLDLARLGVDLRDGAVEVLQRARDDVDRLADLDVGGGALGELSRLGAAAHDLLVLLAAQRRGLALDAGEAGDTGGVADDGPDVVVHLHAHEHVTREDLGLLGLALAAVLDLRDLLGRNLDVDHGVLEAVRLDAVLEIGLDLVLVARVGMDNVPTLRHASPSVP